MSDNLKCTTAKLEWIAFTTSRLHPQALRNAVFEATLPFYDANLDSRVRAAKSKWQEEADEALLAHPGYSGASQRIKALGERNGRRKRIAYRAGAGRPNPPGQCPPVASASRSRAGRGSKTGIV